MRLILLTSLLILTGCASRQIEKIEDLIAPEATIEQVSTGFKFTEGPANDANGNIYFTDIPNNKILFYNHQSGETTVFKDNSGGANGLWVKGNSIIACQGNLRQLGLISIEDKSVKTLCGKYSNKAFNKPNDLWPDAHGGIYFSDPNYRREPLSQDGEHIYYLRANGNVVRVAYDYVRPNGLIGTKNGKNIYITDRSGGKTFKYDIEKNGSLSSKRLFCEVGSDGMTLDELGNLYVTAEGVEVFSPSGQKIGEIKIPEKPTNCCFGGPDGKTLFVTARTSLYAIRLNVKGMW